MPDVKLPELFIFVGVVLSMLFASFLIVLGVFLLVAAGRWAI